MRAKPTRPPGTEITYQYGFLTPGGQIVVCGSLEEARFYVTHGGADLMYREIQTVVGPWQNSR